MKARKPGYVLYSDEYQVAAIRFGNSVIKAVVQLPEEVLAELEGAA